MPNAETIAQTDVQVGETHDAHVAAYFNISVFTRHSEECPQAGNPVWKRCKCRKHLYIYENGKVTYKSALTRSWEQAEKVAQAERDARDPVKIELLKIAEREAQKRQREAEKEIALDAALDRWLGTMKEPRPTSMAAYRSTTRRILRWAEQNGTKMLSEITGEMLDAWRASWGAEAEADEDRLAKTTQATLIIRIRSFFGWAHGIGLISRNPAATLKSVTPDDSETMPLSPAQFEELLAATDKMDADPRYGSKKVGQHLRALFLVQRWTGLRVGDALQIRKTALEGNRLIITMQKRGNQHSCILPDQVVSALNSLPHLAGVDPTCYFVNPKTKVLTETNKWVRKIARLNEFLAFKHPITGEPMEFHSHMLRDTFAVELLKAGIRLEKVSKLLGHKSVTTTEKYYAKWVPERLRQLEDESVEAMRLMGAKFGGD